MARLPKAGPLRVLVLLEAFGIAREHLGKLDPAERTRLLELLRTSKGRPSGLTPAERADLKRITAKLELRSVPRKLLPLLGPGRGKRGLFGRH